MLKKPISSPVSWLIFSRQTLLGELQQTSLQNKNQKYNSQ